jgi:hypothetical protein
MNERKLSKLQKDYRKFFLEKLSLYDVNSPADLTKEKKSVFFTEIKNEWAKYKILQKQKLEDDQANYLINVKKLVELSNKKNIEHEKISTQEEDNETKAQILTVGDKSKQNTSKKKEQLTELAQGELEKQIIKSEPNNEQSNDLKILFTPNNYFIQEEKYQYPVVKMPKQNNVLKLPRLGRSNQRGYKEYDFFNEMKLHISDIEITDNVHMVIPNYNKPYEPDIVLFDKKLNLYIDVEIDEPYDGYYRYPTHFIDPEDESKKDYIRDLFFTESGWIVVRFTEKQVHCEALRCIDYIKNIIYSINNRSFIKDVKCEMENQWDYNQCIKWQKINYREKYLGIDRFLKQYSSKEIEIDISQIESVESLINRSKKLTFSDWKLSLGFDEKTHIYAKDETGNSEYISVTTLIERFFPFDLNRYIERKAEEENRIEEDILDEYELMRHEAAEKGTDLHSQIENYLLGKKFDSDSDEFIYFLNFYNKEIVSRNLEFSEAEKMIVSNTYNVAGIVDCLFKKNNNDEYVILDWKRSKKLIIDGRPRIFGYGYALSELNTLDNSSYNRYCLQQNVYKYILEAEYAMKISSMKLIVLHENYLNYHIVDVPIMKKETSIILQSLKVKI